MKREWTSAAARRVREYAGATNVDQAIDKIARDLLHEVPCPPTDLCKLLPRLHVRRVESDDDLMVTGALKREEGDFVIHVYPGLSLGRRRFTIAHELGHAFMETTGPHAPRFGEELEEICDRLAAELLMPRRTFLQYVGRYPDLAMASDAAAAFRASRAAVFRRLRELRRIKSCEYEDGSFNWSFGLGNIERSNLRRILQETGESEGHKQIELYYGRGYARWNMEWRRSDAAPILICLLTPT